MTEKNPKTKTIEVTVETYERLHSAKTNLSKILHKPVSFDMAFRLCFAVQPLDLILSDMILETVQQGGVSQ